MTAADRIYEVLDTQPSIVDRPGAVAAGRATTVRGRLRFEGVAFSYPGATAPVLRGVDLSVRAGRDAGHRRRHRLRQDHAASPWCPGCIDVTAGRITLDGRDIRDLTLDSLRRWSASRSRSRRCSR